MKKVCTFALAFEICLIRQSGCSAVGSALRSGRRGRKFESCHPDRKRVKTLFFSVLALCRFNILGDKSACVKSHYNYLFNRVLDAKT